MDLDAERKGTTLLEELTEEVELAAAGGAQRGADVVLDKKPWGKGKHMVVQNKTGEDIVVFVVPNRLQTYLQEAGLEANAQGSAAGAGAGIKGNLKLAHERGKASVSEMKPHSFASVLLEGDEARATAFPKSNNGDSFFCVNTLVRRGWSLVVRPGTFKAAALQAAIDNVAALQP